MTLHIWRVDARAPWYVSAATSRLGSGGPSSRVTARRAIKPEPNVLTRESGVQAAVMPK